MRYYESLYIVNPNFEQGKLDDVMKTVTETISEFGFKTINHFVWGKKRLAYNIQEHKYGSYVWKRVKSMKSRPRRRCLDLQFVFMPRI